MDNLTRTLFASNSVIGLSVKMSFGWSNSLDTTVASSNWSLNGKAARNEGLWEAGVCRAGRTRHMWWVRPYKGGLPLDWSQGQMQTRCQLCRFWFNLLSLTWWSTGTDCCFEDITGVKYRVKAFCFLPLRILPVLRKWNPNPFRLPQLQWLFSNKSFQSNAPKRCWELHIE